MEVNERVHAIERRRVPIVMRVTAAVTSIACMLAAYTLYHHYAAPYETKADLRIDRPVMMMCVSLALVACGIWLWRRYAGRLVLLSYLGAIMMVPALVLAAIVATGAIVFARPLVAYAAYDAAATEFSTELARLLAPAPKLKDAKQAAVDALESGGDAELRRALLLIREAIPVLEQDRDDIATLEVRGREMFHRRDVWFMRTDAYFGWKEPLRETLDGWSEASDAAVARYRDLERQLAARLGDAPPA